MRTPRILPVLLMILVLAACVEGGQFATGSSAPGPQQDRIGGDGGGSGGMH